MLVALEGARNRVDRLPTPDTYATKRTGAIVRVGNLREIRGSQRLPGIPASVSYDLAGRLLRNEIKSDSPQVVRRTVDRSRSLTLEIDGKMVNGGDETAGYGSLEVSTRRLRRTDPRADTDRVPSYRVSPYRPGSQSHFELLYVPEGSAGATLIIPDNVERLVDGQYISSPNVVIHELEEGDLVALSTVPYALDPHRGEFQYGYVTSDSHLDSPGHLDPAVFPVEIVGELPSSQSDTLYVKGQHHRGLIGSRLNGESGPEIALPRSRYKSLRMLTDIDVADMRFTEADEGLFVTENDGTTVFDASDHRNTVGV